MMQKPNIPDFIGVGAMRCGTTWIADKLRSHPEIFIPPHYKELQFFDRFYENGFEWYLENFSSKGQDQIAGEFTPNYLRHSKALELIHQHLPDVKLIISLRNPIDRAFSHYNFLKNRKNVSESFYDALFDERFEILKAGLYGEQIQKCLEYFQRENIHFVIFDDIQTIPEKVTSELYEYLGVKKDFQPEMLSHKVNARHGVKSKIVSAGLRKLKHMVRPFIRIRQSLINLGVYKLGRKLNLLNAKTTPQIQMEKRARDYLSAYYADDLRLTNSILNGKISHWLPEAHE